MSRMCYQQIPLIQHSPTVCVFRKQKTSLLLSWVFIHLTTIPSYEIIVKKHAHTGSTPAAAEAMTTIRPFVSSTQQRDGLIGVDLSLQTHFSPHYPGFDPSIWPWLFRGRVMQWRAFSYQSASSTQDCRWLLTHCVDSLMELVEGFIPR